MEALDFKIMDFFLNYINMQNIICDFNDWIYIYLGSPYISPVAY